MTLTLEVPETVERTFREGARLRGVAPEKYFAELVQREAQSPESTLGELYDRSLANGGELTALTTAPGDVYQYNAADLAAMEAGQFERPQR